MCHSEKPCGITIDACQQLARRCIKRNGFFQAGTQRRSVPQLPDCGGDWLGAASSARFTRCTASIYVSILENSWLPAQPQPETRSVRLEHVAGTAPWRPFLTRNTWMAVAASVGFDSGGALLDGERTPSIFGQWANDSDDTMPIEYEPTDQNIVCRYANGVKLILDFLKQPFGDRSPHYITRLGTCPVRFIGEEGWVETGDSGEMSSSPHRSNSGPGGQGSRVGCHGALARFLRRDSDSGW